MERPSKEQLTGALNFVHVSDSRDASREWEVLDILVAEVRALRSELSAAFLSVEDALEARDKWHNIAHEQKAKVERVEADLDYAGHWVTGAGPSPLLEHTRERLRKALRGPQ